MKLEDVQRILRAESPRDARNGDRQVGSCHASVLMSDLLAFRGRSGLGPSFCTWEYRPRHHGAPRSPSTRPR